MFLDKIEHYSEESNRLKAIYSKKCTICNGEGLQQKENGSGLITCDCIKKANIQARLLCNGMPRKYLENDWDNSKGFLDDTKAIQELQNFCNNIVNNMFNGSNLFIHSTNKIKIMELDCIVANDLAYKKNYSGYFHNILFVTAEDLMQTVYSAKNNFEQKTKLQKAVTSVDILILNYLGEETENRSEHTSKYINDLFIQRAFNEKINIVSSSLGIEEIANKYGPQFMNTIKHNFKLVKLSDMDAEQIEKDGDEGNGYY